MNEGTENVRTCQVEPLENVLQTVLNRVERKRNEWLTGDCLRSTGRGLVATGSVSKVLTRPDGRATLKSDLRAGRAFRAREIVEGILFGLLLFFVVVVFAVPALNHNR